MRTNGRFTVYNNIALPEKMDMVNPENIQLENDFIDYLYSTDKSQETIKQYRANLHVFWCWNLEFNDNISFIKFKKRQLVAFQNHALNVWKWSPSRIKAVKGTLSSFSNFIEDILDEEYPKFKSIIKTVKSPVPRPVRKKTVFDEEGDIKPLLDHLVANKEYMKACAVSLAINSGRRKSELIRFKVGYFRPEYTICNGALYKTPEMVKTKGRGGGGKMLYLYTLAAPFNPYLELWLEERRRLHISSQWLFPLKKGSKWYDEPMLESTLAYWARQFSEITEQPFYWHSLRHFFATKLSNYDIPLNVIQSLIGWESADMVNLYDDTSKDVLFEKYFGEEGIKKRQAGTLQDL